MNIGNILRIAFAAVFFAATTTNISAVETRSHAPTGETFGAKLRRLEAAARNNNPLVNSPLIGAKPWKALSGAWTSSTAYTVGTLVSNGGYAYICTRAGTSAASGGPTGTSPTTILTDGSADWVYYMGAVGDQVSNGGWVFKVTTAGLPATSGSGPTPAALTDGAITWTLVGPQTAPTVTFTASHNGTYSNRYNPQSYLGDNQGVFRYQGGVPSNNQYNLGIQLPSVNLAPANGNYNNSTGATTYSTVYGRIDTMVEDVQVEINLVASGMYRLIVNGSYLDWIDIPVDYASNNGNLVLDWTNAGGRARRQVSIEMSGASVLGKVSVNPTGTLTYPPVGDNFSVAFIGDSMGCSTNATGQATGYFARFAKRAGLPDSTGICIGGTGVIASNASQNYIGHAIGDLANLNAFRPLGAIFVQSSTNDTGFGALAIQAAALSFIQAIRAAYPTVPIIAFGFAQNNASNHPQATAAIPNENAWKAAVAAQNGAGDNLTFWIPITSATAGPMITGTGYVGATQNNGNGDFTISFDSLHPADPGYDLWSIWLDYGYRGILAQIP